MNMVQIDIEVRGNEVYIDDELVVTMDTDERAYEFADKLRSMNRKTNDWHTKYGEQ